MEDYKNSNKSDKISLARGGSKFSVIIASYNGAETLSRAIDSVLAQSYSNFEIIIIDDGSSDATSEVVGRYGDKVLYVYQNNSGVSSARNAGAKLAQGDWLTFLDADDWYYPDRLLWHAELIRKNPGLDFLIGDYHYGQSDGSIIKRAIDSCAYGQKVLSLADENHCVFMDVDGIGELISSYFGHTLSFSVPREKFLALGGFDEQFSIGEDFHLVIRLCVNARSLGVACQPMGIYVVHDSGLIRSNIIQAQIKTVKTLSSLKDELKRAPSAIKQGFYRALLNARFDLATALIRMGQHKKAILSFLPSLIESISFRSIKMFLSIIKG